MNEQGGNGWMFGILAFVFGAIIIITVTLSMLLTKSPKGSGTKLQCFKCINKTCSIVSEGKSVCGEGEHLNNPTCNNECKPKAHGFHDCYSCQPNGDCNKTQINVKKCKNYEFQDDPTCEGGKKCQQVPKGETRLIFHNFCNETGIWATSVTKDSNQVLPMNGVSLKPGQTVSVTLPIKEFNGTFWMRTGCSIEEGKFQCKGGNCNPDPKNHVKCINDHNDDVVCSKVYMENMGTSALRYRVSHTDGFTRSYAIYPESGTGVCTLSGGRSQTDDTSILRSCPDLNKLEEGTLCASNYRRCQMANAEGLRCKDYIQPNGCTSSSQLAEHVWGCQGTLEGDIKQCHCINEQSRSNQYWNYMNSQTPNSQTLVGSEVGHGSCETKILHIVACPS